MNDPAALTQRLAELKRSFDESFSRPAAAPLPRAVDFLLVRAAQRLYAIRLDELSGLEVDRRIVPIPADVPALLGLCGVRGRLVAAFDLAAILGAAGRGPTRWLALHQEWLALAIESVEGTRAVEAKDIHSIETAPGPTPLVRQAIAVESVLVHVVDVASVVSGIQRAAHPARRQGDRHG